jgi:hypothetical protein
MPNQPTEGNTLPADGRRRAGDAGRPGANAPVVADNAPSRDVKLTFAQIAPPPGSMVLRGINPNGGIEFGMRSDEVVSNAVLNLEYTPSPSLLPVQSQLKVYLNDELMDVLPVTKEQLGKKPGAGADQPAVHHRL